MQQRTIYVCDNSEQVWQYLAGWLGAAGHQVFIYSSAEQLIDLHEGHNAEYRDLTFIDDQLPGLPMDELLKRLLAYGEILQMLVRAYDPCISCSTHALQVSFV